ncbi:MAG TPA: efflux RND transporter periplasmic adaptor subunit [Opitutus sp.]|nr:efflux RND transporter periplasmic adaptor subunit [Opitutus sp.]
MAMGSGSRSSSSSLRSSLIAFSLLLPCLPAAAQSSLNPAARETETFTLGGSTSRGSLRSVLRPVLDVSLSARAAGIVEFIRVPEGTEVKASQPIISLDSNQERAELAQAKAAVRGADAELSRAENEFDRMQRLREDKIYSEKQLQEAKAAAELARSRQQQAVAAMELAKVRLENRDIVSPIDGIFLKTNKLVGEAVERYETVARVVDVTSLEMVVYCDARHFPLFKTGQQVQVRVLKSTEEQPIVTGTISHVDPIIDPSSGTFRVKVRIERSADAIPGLPAILIAPS